MKTTAPTPFQAGLLSRALNARRYTDRHRALWSALYAQAKATVRAHRLSWDPEEVVSYWLDLATAEESPSAGNTVALDDIATGFKTISQEAGSVVVPLDSLEEYGDTWQEAPRLSNAEQLSDLLDWSRDVHPVTQRDHLPRWCDGTSDPVEEIDPAQNYEPLVAYYPPRFKCPHCGNESSEIKKVCWPELAQPDEVVACKQCEAISENERFYK